MVLSLGCILLCLRNYGDQFGVNAYEIKSGKGKFVREIPTISQQWVCERATLYKLQLLQKANTLATQTDDDILIELEAKYKGNILYDYETRARQKLFRVVAVQYVKSNAKQVLSCWEATCEPVIRRSDGSFHVPTAHLVQGPTGASKALASSLQGYALAEFCNGDDALPVSLPWVDLYIRYFNDNIASL